MSPSPGTQNGAQKMSEEWMNDWGCGYKNLTCPQKETVEDRDIWTNR